MENRYDKYKDSGIAWIREIPEHWEIKRLKNVSDFNPQNDQSISNFSEVGYLPMERLKNGYMLPSVINVYNLTQGLTFFKENDIVMAKVTPCFENGNIAIAKNLINNCGFGSSELFIFRVRNINRKYFFYLLQEEKIKEVCKSTMIGTGGLKRISPTFMRNLLLPIPTTLEQQSIATYLEQKCSEIDELITLQEEMITKLQSYKQSVITEAVTKGLDKNVPLKDSGIEWIGEIPEHWKVVKIKYLAKIKSGDSISSNELIQAGIYEVYGGNGLMGYCNKNNVNGFNIIIGRVGALCGNVRLISDSKFITDNALILNCFDNALYPYMYIMLKAANLNNLNTSNAQPLITGSKVLNVSLPIPPLSEQQSIADYLDQKCSEIDELISIKQQKIEKLKDYKKSLIFECVTGKRKV
ncbi:restriction endonuclease subunit S [Bacteroides sp. ET336]|uniref:restriction endonuclease subunit S n=1 Tax=Bacteroides sp. ET336 TaxID=2972459 RepID=UPI0021AD2681|nr:restriction endonuclease subunit S [Bacteroides sp. ET336]MCR8892998.1 restriction endonuclease subunit S [Bacteroides sp. ET336]MDN0057495.1 restriction endonuclease subunit S [Bacteroides caecigallinarum]